MEKSIRKINILHLAKKYDGNRPLRNIMILGIDPERYNSKVCYLSGKPDGKNILDRYGLSIYLDIDNPSKHKIRTIIMLRNCLKNEMPDILHCHRHAASVFGILARVTHKTKIISHVHGLDRTRSFKRRFTNWLLFRRVDRIITVSKSVRKDVLNTNWSIDPAKVVNVKNALDLGIVDSVKISKMDARVKLEIREDEVVFGTVGRLVPTKGQSYLIEAFSQAQRKIPNSRLVVVGDGPLFKKLKNRAEELGISSRVLFTGFREDVLELIRGFDVFVLPSLAEGLSIALLEAMASKLPVIASDVGGIPEVFLSSHCGRLVPPKDVSALSSAMIDFGSLNYEQKTLIGDSGRKRIEKEFTPSVMIRNLHAIYESVLSGAE